MNDFDSTMLQTPPVFSNGSTGVSINIVYPEGIKYHLGYINFLEGCKTRIKNMHWAAKNLLNSDKKGVHQYLDAFLFEVSSVQDTIAEVAQGMYEELKLKDVVGEVIDCETTSELMNKMISKTLEYYSGLTTDAKNSGIKSDVEVFISLLYKYKYLFRLTE